MANILKTIAKGVLMVFGVKYIADKVKSGQGERKCPDPDFTVDQGILKYIPNQLVIWKKPAASPQDFDQWKNDNLERYSGILVKSICSKCDDTLELWEGDNVSTFISERVAGSGSNVGGSGVNGGSDAVACFSYNLIIDLPEPIGCIPEKYDPNLKPGARPELTDPPIIVAVFDTGLITTIRDTYTGVVDSCMQVQSKGWNFVYDNDITKDDNRIHHGSTVSQFIIEQESLIEKQKISILPVKVHNSHGKSDLFSILCGLAYAANCGAKIVNASFGFYASKGSKAPAILAQFVKKHLTDNNILLIAAAGNVNEDNGIGRINPIDTRNLDQHPFFPACLSKTLENVLAVTTISLARGEVCPTQNYSNSIVDVGVECDVDLGEDFRFHDPLNNRFEIVGSSYATPIITGKIAQYYTELMVGMPPGKIIKSILLNNMRGLNIMQQDAALNLYIKDGNYARR